MAGFIASIKDQARSDVQTIVLPEGDDERTRKAAQMIQNEGIAHLIILGHEDLLTQTTYDLSGSTLVNLDDYEHMDMFVEKLTELRKHKGMTLDKARELLQDSVYVGAMMVKCDIADGMVAGAIHATSDVLRPCLQIIKTAPNAPMVSSFFIMDMEEETFGEHGIMLFSDCGLVVHPNAEDLATIALSSAESFESLVGAPARIAMLSHSSFGSAKNEDALKVVEATRIAKERRSDVTLDGEMQLDCAIVPSVAALKAPDSAVAGHANALIFPDLDAGNIGYKLVQRLAHAEAYGPITQGLAKPANDLSRGCSAEDIVGVVAITAVQAQLAHKHSA